MHYLSILTITAALLPLASSLPTTTITSTNISIPLFASLEELSRIVDISYCVGTSGISHPFLCASRCDEFPSFELVSTFNTGPLMSDSCGYIVLDHSEKKRLIVAFRGTYSIANTIVDLSTIPQEYVPYPGDPSNDTGSAAPILPLVKTGKSKVLEWIPGFRKTGQKEDGEPGDDGSGEKEKIKCSNCTVHSGFWTSWQNTRPIILPYLEENRKTYPEYSLHLVGHSLGGAVAALAGLEFDALGWEPTITTFGEPKVGNSGMRTFVDKRFGLPQGNGSIADNGGLGGRYRRVTHVDDPVPLLPLQEWGYRPHAGEVYISKSALQPSIGDLQLCHGDEDLNCIAGAEAEESWFNGIFADFYTNADSSSEETPLTDEEKEEVRLNKRWGIPIPSRYKMWQLFFAHRDYFWRLGLCVSGGDPSDWGRDKYKFPSGGGEERPEL